MKNNTTIPMTDSKDERNLNNLLSSMNDREIQEIYTHIRIKNIAEDFESVADYLMEDREISSFDYNLIVEEKEKLAIRFINNHDWTISDYDAVKAIIQDYLNDMKNFPVFLIFTYNHTIYIHKFKNFYQAQKTMKDTISNLMGGYDVKVDISLSEYKGVYCGWDQGKGWLYYGDDNYDWSIVYENKVPYCYSC